MEKLDVKLPSLSPKTIGELADWIVTSAPELAGLWNSKGFDKPKNKVISLLILATPTPSTKEEG